MSPDDTANAVTKQAHRAPEPVVQFVDLTSQREELGSTLDDAIARVLAHGQFIGGPEVDQLEQSLAARAQVAHVTSCASGTDALLLPLLAWGIGEGDAVFVPSFTFVATAEVASLVGATPVFCDVQRSTGNIDPEGLGRAIAATTQRTSLRPRAVIPVDLYGQPADYDTIQHIAAKHDMKVLVDAAQSFGSTYRGRPTGSLGDATATSFFPAKPLGCYGDGGAILTDDDELAAVTRALRRHGRASGDSIDRIGLNSRLDTVQAAVLLVKLIRFDDELARRRAIARRYVAELDDSVETPHVSADRTSTWAQFTIRSPDRDALSRALGQSGIPTAIYYSIPLHRQPAYRDLAVLSDCPIADELSSTVLSLPVHPYLTADAQATICETIRQVVAA